MSLSSKAEYVLTNIMPRLYTDRRYFYIDCAATVPVNRIVKRSTNTDSVA